jgi:hypothetical protein
MATIITVHGTGASGPEEGDKWWQKGSEFEKHIRELVEGADRRLEFKPRGWDGANSEISRRKAAAKLYGKVKELEEINEKYCIVGHSHGGSVIADALLLAGSERNPLQNLTRFITVGTPFIESVKSFWLFTRLGLIGESVLASATAFAIFMAIPVLKGDLDIGAAKAMLIILLPLIAAYWGLWFLNRRRFYMYRPRVLRFAAGESHLI